MLQQASPLGWRCYRLSVKRIAIIIAVFLPCVIAAAFWRLDGASALMVSFSMIAVVFFGTLPWFIGAAMDRRKIKTHEGAQVVRGFQDEHRAK